MSVHHHSKRLHQMWCSPNRIESWPEEETSRVIIPIENSQCCFGRNIQSMAYRTSGNGSAAAACNQ